jgi:hypothetical protein
LVRADCGCLVANPLHTGDVGENVSVKKATDADMPDVIEDEEVWACALCTYLNVAARR